MSAVPTASQVTLALVVLEKAAAKALPETNLAGRAVMMAGETVEAAFTTPGWIGADDPARAFGAAEPAAPDGADPDVIGLLQARLKASGDVIGVLQPFIEKLIVAPDVPQSWKDAARETLHAAIAAIDPSGQLAQAAQEAAAPEGVAQANNVGE